MEVDEREYQLKPMNCPFHVLTYASKLRSYRELPIRWAELGTVYRYERPGVMHGLMRVRGFTQDDAHVFCLPEQISDEILKILDLTERILSTFDFNNYEINSPPSGGPSAMTPSGTWPPRTDRSWSAKVGLTKSMRAVAPSMARKSISKSKTPSAGCGSAHHSARFQLAGALRT